MKSNARKIPNDNKDLLAENAHLNELYNAAIVQLLEQNEMDELLMRSEKRFKTVFEQSNIACKIINQNLEILEVNNAVSILLGFSTEEIIGSHILDYTRDDFKEQWHNLQEALWNHKLPFFQLEVCLIKKDGTEVWCSVNTILFEDKQQEFGYTMLENITYRKDNDRKKDELINVVSHELKSPVSTLKAFAQILEKKLHSIDKEAAKVMLKKIVIQSERLNALITNLLDVTRIESGKLILKVEEYNFSAMIKRVLEGLQPSSKHTFEMDIADDIVCFGDEARMEQVVINLLTNALKYSPAADKVVINTYQENENAIFKVRDFGPGISQEDQAHLFERFFRTGERESGQIPGLGLGLYICAEIIELHLGRLFVESEPGKGSVFGFDLPLSYTKEEA